MERTAWLRWVGISLVALALAACAAKKSKDSNNTQNTPAGGGSGNSAAPSNNGNSGSNSGSNNPSAGSGGAGASNNGGAPASGDGGKAGSDPSNGGNGGKAGGDAMNMAVEMLDPDVDWTALTLVAPKLYSAYDGTHTFQIPVHVDGATVELADWQAIPSDAVTFDPDPDGGGVMITIVKGVEDITIAVHTAQLGGTAPLHVTQAKPADWETGEARYNNGVDYELPTLDFAQLIDPNWVPPPTPKDLACNNCHSTGAKYFEIQHTPTQIGNLSDEDLITIFTTGMKPPGVPFHVIPEELQHLYAEFHTWEAGADQQKGLIVYLRSLTPTGQGTVSVPDGSFAP